MLLNIIFLSIFIFKKVFILYIHFFRENPKRAERRSLNETCLPVFKYFKPKRKSKVLVHGFGDSAEDSLMFPILRDGECISKSGNPKLIN